MKKLDITPISNSAQFFPKKGTLEFLQLAFQEGFTELIKSLIGPAYSGTTVYVLRGVINSGTAPTYTTTEGVVFYGGEFFLIDAASFTAGGSDVAVFSIVTTQYTTDADPCTFSDASTHNIHDIRKMQLTAGASGSGLANLSQAFYMNFIIPAQLNLTGAGQAVVSGGYPNLVVTVPNSTNLNPVLFAGSYNVGDVLVQQSFAVSFGTTLATANYYVIGSFVSNGTPLDDATITWAFHNRLTTGFTLDCRETAAVTQNVAFEYIIFAK